MRPVYETYCPPSPCPHCCYRLWAEIFQVQEDDEGDISWVRISDDVVPVNITCIADHPDTVFQITAYNRHVEKIFDVKLIQPGTSRRSLTSNSYVQVRR